MDTTIPITVHPWDHDGGHLPASAYVELFWLPVIGPTATWMWRRLASVAAATEGPVAYDLEDLAAQLGVRAPVVRHSLERLVTFGLLQHRGGATYAVRTSAPRLRVGSVTRLPESLREAHASFERQAVPA